jgi:hypothetical protein
MVRKRREADENKSVITSSHMYANNAHYVSINSGRDHRIELGESMHPLNPDECDVYTSLVECAENSTIRACMNHHITESGEVEGFRYTCSGADMSACLPLSRMMFTRTSMVECENDTEEEDDDSENSDEKDDLFVIEKGEETTSSNTNIFKMKRRSSFGSCCSSNNSLISTMSSRKRSTFTETRSDYESFMNDYNSSLSSSSDVRKNIDHKKKEIGLTTAAMLSSRIAPIPTRISLRGGRESMTILNLLLRSKVRTFFRFFVCFYFHFKETNIENI